MAVSLSLFACGTAQAADWVRVNFKGDGFPIYVDASSIEHDGDMRTAWAKIVYPRHSAKTNDGTKYVSVLLEMVDIHCSAKEWRTRSTHASFEDGSGASDEAVTEWAAVPPDTFAERVMIYLCKATHKPIT